MTTTTREYTVTITAECEDDGDLPTIDLAEYIEDHYKSLFKQGDMSQEAWDSLETTIKVKEEDE